MTTNNVVGNPTGVALIRTARYFPLKATCSSTSDGEEKTCLRQRNLPNVSRSIVGFRSRFNAFPSGRNVHAKTEDSETSSFDREPPRVRGHLFRGATTMNVDERRRSTSRFVEKNVRK